MPELPEVEVLARHLHAHLCGRRVEEVDVRRGRLVRPQTPRAFAVGLEGAVIESVGRRAKYMVVQLGGRRGTGASRRWLVHLGMTGRLLLGETSAPLPSHTAAVFKLTGVRLVFVDPRGFGRMTMDDTVLEGLGPEPLEPDFRPETLAHALRDSRQAVKVRLLDQSRVAGVGNIYASEALFRARLSPKRRSDRVRGAEVERLWSALREVLEEAIRLGSTLPLDFTGDGTGDGLFYHGLAEGAAAGYEERLRVYDREGEPCLVCGRAIRRWIQAARSTYYCPVCQR
ncbi:MAG: bifunctional DNA-formamidopyrimidine glycosylase/DNA-(apurinic or apyrimidinic site) lyase [Verrucomicrobiales bacterium]|nr:bifunctional DNA-formamidopyrimidine glycosylase/DNA-(apurinic or apyrimidinic site) lyase [Verrucomicrobiales bacterium]